MLNLDDIESKGIPGFNFGGQAGGSLAGLVTALIPWFLGLAGIAMLLYMLYGGLHLMLSRGDPKGTAEARGKITNALLGFGIVFVAFWVVQIVGRVLGLEGITAIFGG